MSSTEPTPSYSFYVHIGAPDPILIRLRSGGALVGFDSTLKFRYMAPAGAVTLGVGTGITLSTAESVSNALATVQLTVAQSRVLIDGSYYAYEVQRTVSGREEVFLMGSLIGEGGANPDA